VFGRFRDIDPLLEHLVLCGRADPCYVDDHLLHEVQFLVAPPLLDLVQLHSVPDAVDVLEHFQFAIVRCDMSVADHADVLLP